jgi:hypothetical protein
MQSADEGEVQNRFFVDLLDLTREYHAAIQAPRFSPEPNPPPHQCAARSCEAPLRTSVARSREGSLEWAILGGQALPGLTRDYDPVPAAAAAAAAAALLECAVSRTGRPRHAAEGALCLESALHAHS